MFSITDDVGEQGGLKFIGTKVMFGAWRLVGDQNMTRNRACGGLGMCGGNGNENSQGIGSMWCVACGTKS